MRSLILVLVVALAACGTETTDSTSTTQVPIEPTTTLAFDPSDLVLYESPGYGFSIAHPADWTVTEVTAENLVGFTAPADGTGLTPNFNVTVNTVPEDLVPVAFYEGEIDRVRSALENAEILEVADVNVDGVIGRGLTVVTRQQDMDIGISRIIVIHEGRAYELSFFAEAAELERLSPLVASVFQSLSFLD